MNIRHLEINELLRNEKTKDLDFSSILYRPNLPQRIVGRKIMEQDHGIDTAYDLKLIDDAINEASLLMRENKEIEYSENEKQS